MDKWKVALVQMNSGADEQGNMNRAESFISQAASEGARLVVLPETADFIGKGMRRRAKPVPGEWDSFFSQQASKHGIWLHGGSVTEKMPEGNPFNTSLLYAPDGTRIAEYRKLHMFDADIENGPSYCESRTICPGEEIVLARTDLGVLGLSICYDLRFPELFRLQSMNGAQVLVLAANFTKPTGEKHWKTLLRARAIENTCYVMACDQCGEKPTFTAYGHSMIISPMGDVIAEAGEEECLLTAEIDLQEITRTRTQITSLQNVRGDIYELKSGNIRIR